MKNYQMDSGKDCSAYTDAIVTLSFYEKESINISESRGWVNLDWKFDGEGAFEATLESQRTEKYEDGWVNCADMDLIQVIRGSWSEDTLDDVKDAMTATLLDMGCFDG